MGNCSYTTRLIPISEFELIAFEEIKRVNRSGNYTEIFLWSGEFKQVWDEHKTLWELINKRNLVPNEN